MTSLVRARSEAKAAEQLADDYRAKGYDVIVEPRREQLPEVLAQFRPDLLARRGDETVLLQVKSRNTLGRPPGIQELAQAVQRLPGWRFELVLAPPDLPYPVPEGIEPWDQRAVASAIEEAEALVRSGHFAAALLVAWAAAEACLRLLAGKERIPSDHADAAHLLAALATSAVISREQYHSLRAAMELRNAVAHGFSAPLLDRDTVKALIELASTLFREANGGRKS
jgi:uncharacterized protein YutE (UPF0331/DUF86 family)